MLVLMCVSVGLFALGRAAAGALPPLAKSRVIEPLWVYVMDDGTLRHYSDPAELKVESWNPSRNIGVFATPADEVWPGRHDSRFVVPMRRTQTARMQFVMSPAYASPEFEQRVLDCLQPSLVERFGVELSTQPTVLSTAWMPIGIAGQAAMAGCVLAGLAAFCFYVRALWLSGALSKLRRRRRLGQCVVCEYPVGSSDSGPQRCPECGYKDEAG